MWLPLLGIARLRKSLTQEDKVKRRPARLAEGKETDLMGLCVHGEGQAVRMECAKVRVTADRWCRTVTQRHE